MGQAFITENIGDSLYKAKPLFNTAALDAELTKLQAAETEYAALILKAFDTLALLEDDAAIARASMNAIIQQWIDGIIAAGEEEPEPIEPDDPNDPETGLPWVDPDRAQEAPLLDLVNAARTAASVGTVSRDDDLDAACLSHLRYQGGNGSMGHTGQWRSKPLNRANQQGYYRPAVIHELLAYGETSPALVMRRWQREPATWVDLLAADVTHAGVAHVYARTHPGSYLWAVLLASAKSDPTTNTVFEDPADGAAEDTEAGLDEIKVPTTDRATPEKLGEAVRLFALAQNKVIAADREVARLMAEKLQRGQRIGELQAEKERINGMEFYIWACYYQDLIPPGTTVETAEVPGFWNDDPVSQTVTLYAGTSQARTITYPEYNWNIRLATSDASGKLVSSIAMTPASVFYNCAMESGHLKWKPIWRYGTLTAVETYNGSVSLSNNDRNIYNNENLDINETATLENVTFEYPPCQGSVFNIGNEVLIRFIGFDRTQPRIIGFRRSPVKCPFQRTSWASL